MSTEIKRIKVDKDTRIEPILKEAGDSPVIIEFGSTAYRINPVGNTSSPFTVESAYASVQTIDGRTGTDVSDEELEAMIDEAKDRYVQSLPSRYPRPTLPDPRDARIAYGQQEHLPRGPEHLCRRRED